jgi:Xaa-Pro aminopeptidase
MLVSAPHMSVTMADDTDSSEYLAPCDARREYITGFTGSAGLAVITRDDARCWTDGRYFLQAGKELGPGWTLMKAGLPETPTWSKWLSTVCTPILM